MSRGWRRRVALPAQLPQGGNHGRQLQPVVTHGDTERLSKQPPPVPGFSTVAPGGEGGASTGAREVQNSSRKPLFSCCWYLGENLGGDRGGANSGRYPPTFPPTGVREPSAGIFAQTWLLNESVLQDVDWRGT